MIFLDDFHAIDGNVLICNNGDYAKYPISKISALECCPICEVLLPAGMVHSPPKRELVAGKADGKHHIKPEDIYCPVKGVDTRVGIGSACEICPACGVPL